MTLDKIEQTLELPYPQERVWRAITSPAELNQWFGDEVIMEPKAGSDITFVWHEHGTSNGVIEVYDPPNCFAYRWRASGVDQERPLAPDNSTLVTFTLSPIEKGTRLELIESGFASLPAAVRDKNHKENTGGWKSELGELVVFLEQPVQ